MTAPLAAHGDSADARFLAGLRERRLFDLAETYCRQNLERGDLKEPARTDYVVELIRTLALHAMQSPPEERIAFFEAARDVAARNTRDKDAPRIWLIRAQDALTPLAQGELCRQEFEVGLRRAEDLEPARQLLRESADLLEKLVRDLAREIPLRRRSQPRPPALSAEDLLALQSHVQLQQARALQVRALLFPPESADRLALLTETIALVDKARLQAGEEDAPQIQLLWADCQRLLGRYDEASAALLAIDQEGIDPALRLRARAQRVQIAVQRGDAAQLQRYLDQGREIAGQSAAELDFARLEGLLFWAMAARAEKNPRLAEKLDQQAVQAGTLLAELHGPLWARKADRALWAAVPDESPAATSALLARKAKSLFLAKDFKLALAAFDTAASAARAQGQASAAFELAYQAALVEQHRGRHPEARDRFLQAGKGLATHPQAAAAHLVGVWHAGQVAAADPAGEEAYAKALREHLAIWPAGHTAGQARLWLGKLEEQRGRWEAAIAAYRAVRPAAGQPWTDEQRRAVLQAAELTLQHLPHQASEAQAALQAAVDASDIAVAEWQEDAQRALDRLGALALAQGSRRDEALAAYRKLIEKHPDDGRVHVDYAEFLLAGEGQETLQAALQQWREIAERSQPRSDGWLRAKYSIALAHHQLGDNTSAAAVLRYLLQTPPGLKGTPWQERCEELLKLCES